MQTFFSKPKKIGFYTLFLLLASSSLPTDVNSVENVLNGEWPVVGQDYGNKANAQSSIDSNNAASLLTNLKFFFPTGGLVTAQPAISNGVAYFGDTSGVVYAVNTTTGQLIWSTSLGNEFITTPSVSDDMIYISGGKLLGLFTGAPVKIFAINRTDGTVAWSSKVDPLSGTLPFVGDYTGDTTIVGDKVIFGVASTENTSGQNPDFLSRGSVVAFNRFTGVEEWRFYTTSNQQTLNPEYGAGVGVWSSPAIDIDRRTLYIGTSQSFETPASPYSDALLAIDYKNGNLKWFSQKTIHDVWNSTLSPYGLDWDVNTHPNLFSAEVQGEGLVDFVGVGDKGGRYFIMRRDQLHNTANSGKAPKITAILFLDEGSSVGAIQATPTVDNVNKVLYVASNAMVGPFGKRTSLNAVELNADTLDAAAYQNDVTPKYAAYNLEMLVNGALAGDALIWKYDSTTDVNNKGMTYGPLTLSNDVIFTTNGIGNVRILKAADGTVISETNPLGAPISLFGGVTVTGTQIFVPTVAGVVCYELP